MRRPVGCTIGVRPQRSLRRTHATTRPGLRHPTAPDHTRKSVYDKTGARHWATQKPRAAVRGAARGAAGAPPGHGRAPLPSRACVSSGVQRRGDEVISARASATPRDSFRRDIEPAARGGVGIEARITSGRAGRHTARVERRRDRVTGDVVASEVDPPAPSSPPPDSRALGRIGGGEGRVAAPGGAGDVWGGSGVRVWRVARDMSPAARRIRGAPHAPGSVASLPAAHPRG